MRADAGVTRLRRDQLRRSCPQRQQMRADAGVTRLRRKQLRRSCPQRQQMRADAGVTRLRRKQLQTSGRVVFIHVGGAFDQVTGLIEGVFVAQARELTVR